jgi:hypothetical protein
MQPPDPFFIAKPSMVTLDVEVIIKTLPKYRPSTTVVVFPSPIIESGLLITNPDSLYTPLLTNIVSPALDAAKAPAIVG